MIRKVTLGLMASFCLAAVSQAQSEANPNSTTDVKPVVVRGRSTGRIVSEVDSEYGGEHITIVPSDSGSLENVLRKNVSVTSFSYRGESGEPGFLIRGNASFENRYFLDGVPLTSAAFDEARLSLIPLEAIKDVQLFSEGIPARYLSDGLGGAADLRLDSFQNSSDARIGIRGGSFEFLKATASTHRPKNYPVSLTISTARSREDYQYYDDNGTPFNLNDDRVIRRSNNQFHRITLLPQIALVDREKQSLRAFGFANASSTGVPGAISSPTSGVLEQRAFLAAFAHEIEWSQNLVSESRLYAKNSVDHLASIGDLTERMATEGRSTETIFGIRNTTRFKLEPLQNEISAGAEFAQYHAEYSLLNRATGYVSKGQFPAAIVVGFKPPQSEFTATSAFSILHAKFAPSDSAYTALSPRLSVEEKWTTSFRTRLTAGHYQRIPSLFERFGSPVGISANPELGKESSNRIELGNDFQWKFDSAVKRLRLSLASVYSRESDLIVYFQNTQNSRVPVNVGASRQWIQEIDSELSTIWNIVIHSSVSLNQSTNLSPSPDQYLKGLPSRPKIVWKNELSYAFGGAKVSYEPYYVGEVFLDLANIRRVPAHWEHHFRGTWSTRSMGTFGLELYNLFDVTYSYVDSGSLRGVESTAGFIGFPAPGRRIYATWSISI